MLQTPPQHGNDVSWVPSCLTMLSGVSSCHVMLYPVFSRFLSCLLMQSHAFWCLFMGSDAFWRRHLASWWVIVVHGSGFLLGSVFWKVFFGPNAKDGKAEMEFVQKDNHEKQELNAECKKMHTMGDKSEAAKRNDFVLRYNEMHMHSDLNYVYKIHNPRICWYASSNQRYTSQNTRDEHASNTSLAVEKRARMRCLPEVRPCACICTCKATCECVFQRCTWET